MLSKGLAEYGCSSQTPLLIGFPTIVQPNSKMVICYFVGISASHGRDTEIPSYYILLSWACSGYMGQSLKETSQLSRSGECGNYSVTQ